MDNLLGNLMKSVKAQSLARDARSKMMKRVSIYRDTQQLFWGE